MDDLISRQAAIDAISSMFAPTPTQKDMVEDCLEIIENLPSAQPERKGRWIRNDNGTYSCSVCQSWIPEQQHYYARYCLYCGADMRGEANDAEIN